MIKQGGNWIEPLYDSKQVISSVSSHQIPEETDEASGQMGFNYGEGVYLIRVKTWSQDREEGEFSDPVPFNYHLTLDIQSSVIINDGDIETTSDTVILDVNLDGDEVIRSEESSEGVFDVKMPIGENEFPHVQNPLVMTGYGEKDCNTPIQIHELYHDAGGEKTIWVKGRAEYEEAIAKDTINFTTTDNVVLTNSDATDNDAFENFPYGGLHCYDPKSMIDNCRLDANDRITQRELMLLEAEGELMILLRRKWLGVQCDCVDSVRRQAEKRCERCYGTTWIGGYDQYVASYTDDGRIYARLDPTTDDLLLQEEGLFQDFKPNAWTIRIPFLRDRDVLVRFRVDTYEEFRYEILNVTRNILFNQTFGRQKFIMQRKNKGDIIYSFPVTYPAGVLVS